MEIALQTVINEKCYLSVQTLQISNADLPRNYKNSLEATNLALQDSVEVMSIRTNKIIDMNTAISQAIISAPIMINEAEGTVNATLQNNEARLKGYLDITQSEAAAYALMKTTLSFSGTDDSQMLNYIKVQALNKFNPENLMVGIPK